MTIAALAVSSQTFLCFGQDLVLTKTEYSKTGDGNLGKENFTFSLSNNILTITDLDFKRTETYGPLKLNTSGFEGESYYQVYLPDMNANFELVRIFINDNRAYKFYFDKKGGNLLSIVETKTDVRKVTKTYYTEKGHN